MRRHAPIHRTHREFLIWNMLTHGTLWTERAMVQITNDIRTRVSWRLGVAPDVPIPASAPNTRADPYPSVDDSGAMTYEAIGKVLGVTSDRVRQIERRACEKLWLRMRHSYLMRGGTAPSASVLAQRIKEEFLGF